MKVSYQGQPITLYSVNTLLQTVGIKRRTLLSWEKDKIIPSPIFKPCGLIRYYTSTEIALYKEAFFIIKKMEKTPQRTLALRRAMIVAQDKVLRYYKLK